MVEFGRREKAAWNLERMKRIKPFAWLTFVSFSVMLSSAMLKFFNGELCNEIKELKQRQKFMEDGRGRRDLVVWMGI